MHRRSSMRSVPFVLAAFALTRASGADDDAVARARALYQDGARLYNIGQYEAAVQAFEGAYAISGAKPLLFNIAQAYRLAGPARCQNALQAYESYLREDATASNRTEVEERIVEMRDCSEREQARRAAEETARVERNRASSPSPKASAEQTAMPRAPGPAPKLLAAAGGGVLVVGGGLFVAARLKFNQVKSTCPCADGAFATWEAVTTTSYVLLATGGVAFAGGVSWWLASSRKPTAPSYAVMLGPTGVELLGTF
jgi:tetratricopeptide (TPR) repeat protein